MKIALKKELSALLAGTLFVFGCLACGSFAHADTDVYLQATVECDTTAPELQAQAAALHNDPVAILNWVRDSVTYENYAGSRKGALATFFTKRGNDFDQASLLVTLLRISGIRAGYSVVLNGSNLVSQIYAVAEVPAALIGGAGGSKVWVPLVPCNKSTFKTGSDLFGTSVPTTLKFDMDSYLSNLDANKNLSGLDVYEKQLRDFLASSANTAFPGKKLADVPRTLSIIPNPASLLATNLPNGVTAVSTPVLAALDDSYRMMVRVELFNGATVYLGQTVSLPQIAGKRLCIDFNDTRKDANGVNYAAIPSLRLAGTALATGTTVPAGGLCSPRFIFSAGSKIGAYSRTLERPGVAGGTFMTLNFDMFASSPKFMEKFKGELATLPTPSIDSNSPADTQGNAQREAYYGRIGALMAQSYFDRWHEGIMRADALLHLDHNYSYGTMYVNLYMNPATVKNDILDTTVADSNRKSPFSLVASWNIDTQSFCANGITKAGVEPAWDSDLASLNRNLYMCGSSANEAMIFEDWQGSCGLSTVRGIMAARQAGIEVAVIKRTGTDAYAYRVMGTTTTVTLTGAQLRAKFPTPAGGVNFTDAEFASVKAELDLLRPGNTYAEVQVPVKHVSYGETGKQVTATVWLTRASDSEGYMFNNLNGGGTLNYISNNRVSGYSFINTVSTISIFDLNPTTPTYLLTTYLNTSNPATPSISGTISDSGKVNAVVGAIGDPVNPVTGEFYHEELPDLQFKTVGGDFALARQYKSRITHESIFGRQWLFNHGERILLSASASGEWLRYYDAEQTPQIMTGSAAAPVYPPGATFRLSTTRPDSQPGYLIVRKDLTQLYFTADGLLEKKVDANGNALTFAYLANSGKLSTITDALGRTVSFTYAANGCVETATDFTGRACRYVYGGVGSNVAAVKAALPSAAQAKLAAALTRAVPTALTDAAAAAALGDVTDLVAFVDVGGNVTTYQYLMNQESSECNHNISCIWLPTGDYLKLVYYKNDTVAYHRNAKGETFNFQYSFFNKYAECWNESGYYRKIFWNDNWDVTRIETEDKVVESMTFDANHNPLTHTDGNGVTTTYSYDSRRNPVSSSVPDGATTTADSSVTYAYAGETAPADFFRVTRSIAYSPNACAAAKPANSATVTDFDAAGRVAFVTYPVDTNGLVHRTAYTYFTNGNPQFVQELQKLATQPDTAFAGIPNTTVEKQYDAAWPCLPIVEIDPFGVQTTISYDGSGTQRLGLVTGIVRPDGGESQFQYNVYGQCTLRRDRLAAGTPGQWLETQYEFDELRRPTRTISPLGAVTRTVYHPARDLVANALVASVIDPLGNSECYEYDPCGRLIGKMDRNGNLAIAAYDGLGRVTCASDALGGNRFYVYDGNGNQTYATDPAGNVTSYAYDTRNRRVSVTPPGGVRTQTVAYDKNGNVVTETVSPDDAALRLVTANVYDNLNRLVSQTVGSGGTEPRVSTRDYDTLGRVVRETGPTGHYTRRLYNVTPGTAPALLTGAGENDDWSRCYAPADPGGRPVHNTVTLRFEKTGTNAYRLLSQSVEEYDASGRAWRVTDGRGNAATVEYDLLGRKTATTATNGVRTEYAYDSDGHVTGTFVYNYAGGTLLTKTTSAYNLRGECVSSTSYTLNNGTWTPLTRTFASDANGNPIRTTDEQGYSTWAAVDALNRKLAEFDPLGNITYYEYDANSNLTAVSDPLDNVTLYSYDARNRKLAETDAAGKVTAWSYDNLNRVVDEIKVSAANGTGDTTRNAYNLFGETSTVTDAFGAAAQAITRRTYWPDGNLKQITIDNTPYNYRAEYDGAGHLAKETDADNTTRTLLYDANGNTLFETRRDGTIVARTYDNMNRLAAVWTHASGITPTPATVPSTTGNYILRQSFTYDLLGNLTAATDYNDGATARTVTRTYDALGRVLSENQGGRTLTNSWDTRSQLTGITYPGGSALAITRDATGRQTGLSLNGTAIATFAYDQDGRLTQSRTGANLANSTYFALTSPRQYTASHREMYRGCQVKADLLSFPNLVYAYNGANGSLLQVTGNWNGTVLQYPTYNHRSQATNECVERVFFTDSGTLPVIRDQRGFTYDPRGSLTAETGTTAGTWALDPARNWTTTNQNGSTETRTSTGGDNEYDSITAGGAARAITYDLNGNVTGYTEPDGAATNAYTYDWNNRLTSATRTAGGVATTTTWTYDAFNRRAVETTAVNNGSYTITTSTWFVFNGSRVIEEYAAASGGSPVNVHLYRPGTNELLFTVQASSGRRFVYFQDSRGSVLAAGINFMGYDNYFCLAEQYRYSAYGKQTMLNGAGAAITSSLFNNRFGYTGQWSSPALKLAHFPNRDYNPLLGRFLQRDPAGFIDGPNRYAYCHNDPVNYVDPDGRTLRTIGRGAERFKNGLADGFATIVDAVGFNIRGVDYKPMSHFYNNYIDQISTQSVEAGNAFDDATRKNLAWQLGTLGVKGVFDSSYAGSTAFFNGDYEQAGDRFADTLFSFGSIASASLTVRGGGPGNLTVNLGQTKSVGASVGMTAELGLPLNPAYAEVAAAKAAGKPLAIGAETGIVAPGKPFVPESYWQRQSPVQVTPGERVVSRTKLSGDGKTAYGVTDHYDEFGRLEGQTHYSTHPGQPGIPHPDPHFHMRDVKYGDPSPLGKHVDPSAPGWKGTSDPEWFKNPANGTRFFPGEYHGGG